MKTRNFRLIFYATIVQIILFSSFQYEINQLIFLYGVPITRQMSFHMILMGYWYLPIFFIIHYFSEYISKINDYQIIAMMKYGRFKFFLLKLSQIIRDLFIIIVIQTFLTILLYRNPIELSLSNIVRYYAVLIVIVLLENIFELIFEKVNINIIINIFVIASVVIYNFYPMTRNSFIKFVNMLMTARITQLTKVEEIVIIGVIFFSILIIIYLLKRKDLLGDKSYD